MLNKKNVKKIILYTSAASIISAAAPALTLSCGCNKETPNSFSTKYLEENFDAKTQTLDLSKTYVTHIKSGSFDGETIRNILQNSGKSIAGINPKNLVIKKLILPSTIEYIGKAAFSNLEMEEIEFIANSSLAKIDDNAFSNNKIKTIIFPTSKADVKEIKFGRQAFSNNEIANVTLNDKVLVLSEGTFSSNKITTIDLKNVVEIKEGALMGNQISNLTLPNSLTSLHTNFIFANENEKVNNEGSPKLTLKILNKKLKEEYKNKIKENSYLASLITIE
ncbi:leucine-rich repeat domain-containing protein [Metamycoplasma hyosynoviae]|uniref:Leucine-rich repeat domain-containing protein n=1 Tax=Metamycoplasma hyosynoviae TaxID=29559 RepID=A0A9Q9BPW2_9BACT|nr:leucine-rich repeat domain-containing protein [Metamycoplasma hyosynoviae]MDC8900018.1 leucine-rich repeat domain-containing protein [Metamycoplasma hyosynoviae]MDD1358461.1 leucine-rich repeat domain-containing protein [Metamycoplasma hyosynoviae]MDD1361211.1 leucine-rich repeat domain-containing protein [Metamycoplasma hyosynoviae]MDD7912365.1 leucine-rich repeat domain-containing protein [Metamycoplasma hyosynoviae]MDI3063638.1 leucine-rich repeat domain-containing protein [Metamycoplasm